MTIKDLYEEAVKSGREDYDILVQYQDGGGCYSGSAYASEVEWDDTMKEVTVAQCLAEIWEQTKGWENGSC